MELIILQYYYGLFSFSSYQHTVHRECQIYPSLMHCAQLNLGWTFSASGLQTFDKDFQLSFNFFLTTLWCIQVDLHLGIFWLNKVTDLKGELEGVLPQQLWTSLSNYPGPYYYWSMFHEWFGPCRWLHHRSMMYLHGYY